VVGMGLMRLPFVVGFLTFVRPCLNILVSFP